MDKGTITGFHIFGNPGISRRLTWPHGALNGGYLANGVGPPLSDFGFVIFVSKYVSVQILVIFVVSLLK